MLSFSCIWVYHGDCYKFKSIYGHCQKFPKSCRKEPIECDVTIPFFDVLVVAASRSIGSDSDTEIPAIDFEEYRDVLDEDIPRGTMPLPYMFERPLEVSRNHPGGK